MEEMGRKRLAVKFARRALKYEEKLGRVEKGLILAECRKLIEKRGKEKGQEDEKKFLEERS